MTYIEILRVIAGREKYSNIKTFIETGTYKGRTMINLSPHFEKLYTIEISETLHKEAVKIAEALSITNVMYILGDSVRVLPSLTKNLSEGAIFFIDAHQSGTDTINNGENVPIYAELDAILSQPIGSSVFIIDDMRLWENKTHDWNHISTEAIIKKIGEKMKVEGYIEQNDRLYVLASK